jgi:hypothetical protein
MLRERERKRERERERGREREYKTVACWFAISMSSYGGIFYTYMK